MAEGGGQFLVGAGGSSAGRKNVDAALGEVHFDVTKFVYPLYRGADPRPVTVPVGAERVAEFVALGHGPLAGSLFVSGGAANVVSRVIDFGSLTVTTSRSSRPCAAR